MKDKVDVEVHPLIFDNGKQIVVSVGVYLGNINNDSIVDTEDPWLQSLYEMLECDLIRGSEIYEDSFDYYQKLIDGMKKDIKKFEKKLKSLSVLQNLNHNDL